MQPLKDNKNFVKKLRVYANTVICYAEFIVLLFFFERNIDYGWCWASVFARITHNVLKQL